MVDAATPLSTDDAYQRLHLAGWSVGDVCFLENDRRMWMVYAHRGEQKIVAKAPSQSDAWCRASAMADETPG